MQSHRSPSGSRRHLVELNDGPSARMELRLTRFDGHLQKHIDDQIDHQAPIVGGEGKEESR